MKDIVITVVDFFSWLGIIIATVTGFYLMRGNLEYLGALIGFAFGCLMSDVWPMVRPLRNSPQPPDHPRPCCQTGEGMTLRISQWP